MKLNSVKIKELLKKDDRSVTWLARQIGVMPRTLAYQLNMQRLKNISLIAGVFNLNPKELVIFD